MYKFLPKVSIYLPKKITSDKNSMLLTIFNIFKISKFVPHLKIVSFLQLLINLQ